MHSPAFKGRVHAGLLAVSSPMACSFPCGTADSDAAINSSVYSISSTIQNAGGLIADLLTTTILQVPATCPNRFGRFATLAAGWVDLTGTSSSEAVQVGICVLLIRRGDNNAYQTFFSSRWRGMNAIGYFEPVPCADWPALRSFECQR